LGTGYVKSLGEFHIGKINDRTLYIAEEKPFDLPSTGKIKIRMKKNLSYFASNYAVLVILVGIISM